MSSSFFVRVAPLRAMNDAATSISKASMTIWSTTLSIMLRAERAPDCLNLPISMVVSKAATSIGRNKFDLQILNARLREIEDAQNSLIVQTIVGSQKQNALFRRPAAQNVSHARRQFGCSDLLIVQHHAAIRRNPLPCRRLENAASRGGDDQGQPRVL